MKSKTCKFFENATIFDSDFNEMEYKYCTLFGDECKKIKRTKNCPYKLNIKLSKYKQALEKIKKLAEKEYKTPLGQKDCMNCDDSFKRIVDIISEVENER